LELPTLSALELAAWIVAIFFVIVGVCVMVDVLLVWLTDAEEHPRG
jgi:hypothetical protein